MKRLYNAGKNALIIMFIYMITYNIYFFYIYGWHIEPQSDLEEFFDLIAKIGWNIAFTGIILPAIWYIDKLLMKHFEENGNMEKEG